MGFDHLGDSLVTKDGEKPTSEALAGKEFVLVYFSAHWCPPCRGFTPQLAQWYENGGKEKAEVVFVSADQDQAGFDSYFGEMPWVAMPFGSTSPDGKNGMPSVGGYPTLVVLDGEGNFLTDEARGDINPDNVTFWDKDELAARAADKAAKAAAVMARGQPLFDAAFAKMDTSGTGSLSKAEVKAVLEKILPDMVPPGAPIDDIMKQQLDAIMEAADLNSDGDISKEEGWKFLAEQVFSGVEDQSSGQIDQLVGTIEEFINTKL